MKEESLDSLCLRW